MKPKKETLIISAVVVLAVIVLFPSLFFAFITTYDSPDVKITRIGSVTDSSIAKSFGSGTTNANLDVSYLLGNSATLNVQVAQPTENKCIENYGNPNELCLFSKKLISSLRSGNDNISTYDYEYLFLVKYSATTNYAGVLGIGTPEPKNYDVAFKIDYKNQPLQFKSLIIKNEIKCTTSSKCNEVSVSPNPPTSIDFSQNDWGGFFVTRVNKVPFNTVYVQEWYLTVRSDVKLENYFVSGVDPDTSYGTQPGVDEQRQQSSWESLLKDLGLSATNILIFVVIVVALFLLAMFVFGILLARIRK